MRSCTTLAGSVQRDVYYAKARNHNSALDASLFHDNVPVTVYDNLIESVHRHLPALYRYYDLRRRKMRLSDIHHYDTYVPILSELETKHTWNQAVEAGRHIARAAGQRILRILERGLCGPLVRPLPEPGQAERRVQHRQRTTATRTS